MIYFEINGSKGQRHICVDKSLHPYNFSFSMHHIIADRVWEESDSGVSFIKHRHSDPKTTPVNMEEFFWVKLKAVNI